MALCASWNLRKLPPNLLAGGLHVVSDFQQVRFVPKQQAPVAIQVRFQPEAMNCAAATDSNLVVPLHQCACVIPGNVLMTEHRDLHSGSADWRGGLPATSLF